MFFNKIFTLLKKGRNNAKRETPEKMNEACLYQRN